MIFFPHQQGAGGANNVARHIPMTSHRITRTGRDYTSPAHLSDWQRDRAEPGFAPDRRWLVLSPFAAGVLWGALAAVVVTVVL